MYIGAGKYFKKNESDKEIKANIKKKKKETAEILGVLNGERISAAFNSHVTWRLADTQGKHCLTCLRSFHEWITERWLRTC